MNKFAISVDRLSKSYRIGKARGRHDTLRDELVSSLRAATGWLRKNGHKSTDEDLLWAVKDVSFEVERGQVVGVIGRNGAGKSTLLKILSGITKPTEGRAVVRGRVGSLLEVGTGFHTELTGRENIYLSGAILGMHRSEISRKFDEIVEFAEVERFLDTPVKHYSSGMRVRLGFAVAAHLEPEILLVDEVLAVGDAAFQEKCLGKMGDVTQEGRTILFVSHNLGAITDLCDRCVMLEKGALHADGPTARVIQTYLDRGIAAEPVVSFEPKASDAYFTRVGLYDAHGQSSAYFDIRDPIKLNLDFTMKRKIKGLELSIDVFNSEGRLIFHSSNIRTNSRVPIEQKGTHRLIAEIPGRFLPPGRYAIDVELHQPTVELYDWHQHVLTFQIEETGSGLHIWEPKRAGCVLVNLRWKKGVLP